MARYDEAIQYVNLRKAGYACMKNNKWKTSIMSFETNFIEHITYLYQCLQDGTYIPEPTTDFMLRERGKWRLIKAHHIIDRVWYKSWCTHDLLPQVQGKIMYNNSASQVGKGTDQSIGLFRQALTKAHKAFGNDFYVVTTDYHNYFGSIPHEQIVQEIGFKDPRSEAALRSYLSVFPGDCGIGIGGEPSQIIAIMYVGRLDRTITCNCPVFASGRYMDDSWFICKTLDDCKYTLDKFITISESLGLTINEKRTQTHHMTHESVTWLKKRTHLDDNGKIIMELVRNNVRDRIRTTNKHRELVDAGIMPIECAFDSIQCWCAYAIKYNSYYSMKHVVEHFSEVFNVPTEISRHLLHKTNKKWINKCENYHLLDQSTSNPYLLSACDVDFDDVEDIQNLPSSESQVKI